MGGIAPTAPRNRLPNLLRLQLIFNFDIDVSGYALATPVREVAELATSLTRPVREVAELATSLTRPVREVAESATSLTRPVREVADLATSLTRPVREAAVIVPPAWMESLHLSSGPGGKKKFLVFFSILL